MAAPPSRDSGAIDIDREPRYPSGRTTGGALLLLDRNGQSWRRVLLLAALASTTAGCFAAGAKTITTARPLYNVAVQQTDNEQLLLNLVRLRYRDTPFFLEVASVSTAFEFEADGSAAVTLKSGSRSPWDLGVTAIAKELPTITYTPLHGEEFVKQLLSPIDLSTILLLYHSGWSIDRILRVCVQYLNGVPNAPSASGPTPDHEPRYEEFQEAAALLRKLQIDGKLTLGRSGDGEDLEITIARDVAGSPTWRHLAELLSLEPGRTTFRLTANVGARRPGNIYIVTRSVMADLFYISQGVEAPFRDLERGRVTLTTTADGETFDWLDVTRNLMHIRTSDHRPDNAAVSTHYRGSWFYVDDSDLSSKSTFALVTQLLQLQAGEIRSTGPILTLPVSR
jgi:hypothetical protein